MTTASSSLWMACTSKTQLKVDEPVHDLNMRPSVMCSADLSLLPSLMVRFLASGSHTLELSSESAN